jgi:hypothetical protein
MHRRRRNGGVSQRFSTKGSSAQAGLLIVILVAGLYFYDRQIVKIAESLAGRVRHVQRPQNQQIEHAKQLLLR